MRQENNSSGFVVFSGRPDLIMMITLMMPGGDNEQCATSENQDFCKSTDELIMGFQPIEKNMEMYPSIHIITIRYPAKFSFKPVELPPAFRAEMRSRRRTPDRDILHKIFLIAFRTPVTFHTVN
jgi:hypothetical protein